MTGLKSLVFLFFFLLSVSYYRCFYVDTFANTGEVCSDVFCSNDKISNMYENSKFLLTEIEDILSNLRNEKAAHQMENVYAKQLDYETKLPRAGNYEDIYFLDFSNGINDHLNDYSDFFFDQQMEFEMTEPVPFINMSNVEGGNEEFDRNVVNDINNAVSSDEQEIDRLLSKIKKLEEENSKKESTEKSYMKKYFR